MTVISIREVYDKKDVNGNWLRYWNTPTGVTGLYQTHCSLSEGRWNRILKESRKGLAKNLFKDFNEFVKWSRAQHGYDLIDVNGQFYSMTNLLNSEDNTYSPETVFFVPREVCKYVTKPSKETGYPLGVCYDRKRGMLKASIREENAYKFLGYFHDPQEAHRAWQMAKIDKGRLLLETIVDNPRLARAVQVYIDGIVAEYENHEETLLK